MCVLTGLSVCEADDVGITELDQDGDHTGMVELSVVTVVVVVVTIVGVEVMEGGGRLALGVGIGCVVFRDDVEDGHGGSELVQFSVVVTTISVVDVIVDSQVGLDECHGDVQTGVTGPDVVFDGVGGGDRVGLILLGGRTGVERQGVDLKVSEHDGCVQAVDGDALGVYDQSDCVQPVDGDALGVSDQDGCVHAVVGTSLEASDQAGKDQAVDVCEGGTHREEDGQGRVAVIAMAVELGDQSDVD